MDRIALRSMRFSCSRQAMYCSNECFREHSPSAFIAAPLPPLALSLEMGKRRILVKHFLPPRSPFFLSP